MVTRVLLFAPPALANVAQIASARALADASTEQVSPGCDEISVGGLSAAASSASLNPPSRVAHPQGRPAGVAVCIHRTCGRHDDLAAGFRGFDRMDQKINDELAHDLGVGADEDRDWKQRRTDQHVGASGLGLELGDAASHDVIKRDSSGIAASRSQVRGSGRPASEPDTRRLAAQISDR